MHGKLTRVFLAIVCIGVAQGPGAKADDAVTITADCAAVEGVLRRYEGFNNDSLLRPPSKAIVDKMVAALGPGAIHRSWVYLDRYWDPATDRYDFNHSVAGGPMTFYEYLDNAATLGERLLIDLRGPPLVKRVLAGEIPVDRFREAIKRGLAHYRRRCPKIRWVEVFSEMRANAKADDDQYYSIYREVYRAVNEVNAELGLARGEEVLVGGPAPCRYCDEVKGLVERFARDPDPAKRLDFLVYHDYDRKGYNESLARREAEIDAVLEANGLSTRMPVFITEMGCFSTSGALGEIGPDHVAQAACMATLFYYYNRQPDCQAFHWVIQHKSNDRKTQMLDDLAWTPYGCSLKMFKLLRREQIRSDTAVENARGVFSAGSRDASSVAVMVWNYQHAGRASKRVDLRVENLPEALARKPVRARVYLIDATHSNCYHDPKQADLQVVEERIVSCARECRFPLALEPNAMALVELTPASNGQER